MNVLNKVEALTFSAKKRKHNVTLKYVIVMNHIYRKKFNKKQTDMSTTFFVRWYFFNLFANLVLN